MFKTVACADERDESFGNDWAVTVTEPRCEGFQLHVADIFGEVPDVETLMQLAILLLFAKNVTFDGAATFAVRVVVAPKVAVFTLPGS